LKIRKIFEKTKSLFFWLKKEDKIVNPRASHRRSLALVVCVLRLVALCIVKAFNSLPSLYVTVVNIVSLVINF